MGNLVSPSADEPDNRRAPSNTAELPTERDNDAAPALGARPTPEREPAARHTIHVICDRTWLGSRLTTVPYVMYLCFCGWAWLIERILKVAEQRAEPGRSVISTIALLNYLVLECW